MTGPRSVSLPVTSTRSVRHAAHQAGQTVTEYLETIIARHAERLPLPPIRWTPPPARPKRSLAEIRAEQRATSEDGMSTYTRELQIILTTTKENHA